MADESYQISLDYDEFSGFFDYLEAEATEGSKSKSMRSDCDWKGPFEKAINTREKNEYAVAIVKSRVNEEPARSSTFFFSGYLKCSHSECKRAYEVKLKRMTQQGSTFIVFTVQSKVYYFTLLKIKLDEYELHKISNSVSKCSSLII